MEIDDDILILYLLDEASPEQSERVDAWRKRSAANNARFEQFQLLWETSRNLSFDGPSNAPESLHRLKEKAAAQKTSKTKTIVLNRRQAWLRIAAAILLLAGGGMFYFYQRNVPEIVFVTHQEIKADTLSDGSVVTLNKATIFKYPEKFSGRQRQVSLASGEAFFKVSPDKAMPFIIHTGSVAIRVVGTAFNVKQKNGEVEVIVESGLVRVSRNGRDVLLGPGEKVLVRPAVPAFSKEKNPDQLYQYYRTKEFVASNTPLRRMVEVLNDAYNSKIVIGRKELNDLPLNTTFKDESLDTILEIICRTFKLSVEKRHGEIVIK